MKIIELYGLPGCGKTTLRDFFVKEGDKSSSYILMSEMSDQYRKISLFSKLKFIPCKTWVLILKFIISMPILPLKDWKFYKVLFLFSLFYNYLLLYNGRNDCVIIDHGIVQGIISLMNGHVSYLSDKQLTLIRKVLQTMTNCRFVFCKVSVDTSVKRIGMRNRKTGRLDVIHNELQLREKLAEELHLFNRISQEISQDILINNIEINCEQNICMCISEMKFFLSSVK